MPSDYGLNPELVINPEFEEFVIFSSTELTGLGIDSTYRFRFHNNFGASVVKNGISYGHEDDLWELAFIFFEDSTDDNWELIYNEEFPDVVGYLCDEEVNDYLDIIRSY